MIFTRLQQQLRKLLYNQPSEVIPVCYIIVQQPDQVSTIHSHTTQSVDAKNPSSNRNFSIEPPLDFMTESQGWQQLADILNQQIQKQQCIVILHPSLYLMQSTVKDKPQENIFPMQSPELLVNSQTIQESNKELVFTRHSWKIHNLPNCQNVIPWAELIRMFASNKSLQPPWAIVCQQYIWIMDKKYRYHEIHTQTDNTQQLFNTLISHESIHNTMPCFCAPSGESHKQLSNWHMEDITTLPELKSIETLLQSLLLKDV